MELAAKGVVANVEGFKNAIVKLKWTSEADFDLAALYVDKDGKTDMVYYGKKGDLNAYPFMQLDQDAGVGDTGGDNVETLRIMKLEAPITKVLILAWDYGTVQNGSPARFKESDISISIQDETGTSHDVTLDSTDMGNITCVCEINIGPIASTLKNRSDVATIKGLKSSELLYELFKEAV